jgi:predicted lipoprotein with Yx(FWY)xxD motif
MDRDAPRLDIGGMPIPPTKGARMSRNRTITALAGVAAVPLTALAITGCGSSGSGNSASAAPPKTAGGGAATVGVANNANLGRILVDSRGRTAYLFRKDAGMKSACSGECANDWPPIRANGKPIVGRGANASLVGTTTRSDGKPQVTYNGHPLYLYIGDHMAGDANGQGITAFGAPWYVLSAAGNQVSGKAPSSGGGASGY